MSKEQCYKTNKLLTLLTLDKNILFQKRVFIIRIITDLVFEHVI